MSDEEMVPVSLSDDYYLGAGFATDTGADKDYLVPASQLERWEQAAADYGQMQDEIEKAMDAQRERVSALRAERRGPKTPMQTFIEDIYAKPMAFALNISPLLRGPNYQEPE